MRRAVGRDGERGGGERRCGTEEKETRLFAMPSYILKMHHFTKTGSGQTYIGKALKKRPAFLQGFLRDNEDLDEADIAGKLIDYALQKAAVRVAAER